MIPNLQKDEISTARRCTDALHVVQESSFSKNPVDIKSEDSATVTWAPVANDVVGPNECCFLTAFDLCENLEVSTQRSRTNKNVQDRPVRCAKLGVRN